MNSVDDSLGSLADDTRPFCTVADAAFVLRVHRRTLEREIRRGRLRAIRVGRTLRLPLSALRDYIARNASGFKR